MRLNPRENLPAAACYLADQAHRKMMRSLGKTFYVCGIAVKSGDDMQSLQNRFCDGLRRVNFADIDAALCNFKNKG